MATVQKRALKSGKIVYKVTVAGGLDFTGKQIRYYRKWEPPKEGMTERQIEKALNRFIADFEREIEQGYGVDKKQTFAKYAAYVISLKETMGLKTRTIAGYRALLPRINAAIGHLCIGDIRPRHLNVFYQNLSEEGIRQDSGHCTAVIDIREWLRSHRMSAAALAESANICVSTLYEAMKGSVIQKKKADAIAAGMGMDTLEVFSVEIDRSPLSAKTILEYHRFISAVFAQAEKELLVQYNPASKASPPKAKRGSPDYYQPEDLQRIIKALENAPLKWKAFTYMLIDTGCRRGEVVGLKWDHIHLDEELVIIENTLLYTPGKGVFESSTKTDRTRYLRIAPETVAVLREWKELQNTHRIACGDRWHESGYVFTRDTGEYTHPDSAGGWLYRFSKENDLPHIHPHAFRHTAASNMIAHGVDIVTAAGELGHASPITTANTYAHQIAEAKAKAQNVRAGVFHFEK